MSARNDGEPKPAKNRTRVEAKSERDVVVTRTFDAPARIVFQGWPRPRCPGGGGAEVDVDGPPTLGAARLAALVLCSRWPVKGRDLPAPTAKDAPSILVVGTTGDPATALAWAERLAAELESGVLLTYDGEGHTAFRTGSYCVDEMVETYLLNTGLQG